MSDTEFKRLFQPASSTGCFSQRDKTVGINDRAVDDNNDCDVLAVAVFLFLRLVPVHLTLTIRFPYRAVRCCNDAAMAVPAMEVSSDKGLLQPLPNLVLAMLIYPMMRVQLFLL